MFNCDQVSHKNRAKEGGNITSSLTNNAFVRYNKQGISCVNLEGKGKWVGVTKSQKAEGCCGSENGGGVVVVIVHFGLEGCGMFWIGWRTLTWGGVWMRVVWCDEVSKGS